MNWYKGDIAEAVAASKAGKKIFVVFVAGDDDNTSKLSKFIDDDIVRKQLESDKFVAIRVESNTPAYSQFAKIYQMVPVPSIFFIGKTGSPLEIGTSLMNSPQELCAKIESALSTEFPSCSAAASSSAFVESERNINEIENPTTSQGADSKLTNKSDRANAERNVDSRTKVVCEDAVCVKESSNMGQKLNATKSNVEIYIEPTNGNESDNNTSGSNDNDLNVRLEQTRKLLEQKRRERIEEDRRLVRDQELQRRREGKEVQQMQEWQREQELKELKENMRRERLEAENARQRILAQIAADRAERAQKFSTESLKDTEASRAETTSKQAISKDGKTRIQFRLFNGDLHVNNFDNQLVLADIRTYVRNELLPNTGIQKFILATNYPKREFNIEDDAKTLFELGLTPSAVIFIISTSINTNPKAMIQRNGGIFNIITIILWTVLIPISTFFGYLRNKISGNETNSAGKVGPQKRVSENSTEQQDASKLGNLDRFVNGRASTEASSSADATTTESNTDKKPYRRYDGRIANVHRLSDNRKDSDENATWNGNSTQQQ